MDIGLLKKNKFPPPSNASCLFSTCHKRLAERLMGVAITTGVMTTTKRKEQATTLKKAVTPEYRTPELQANEI